MKISSIITALFLIFLSANSQSSMKVRVIEKDKLVENIKPFSDVSWCYYKFETLDKDYDVIYANHEIIKLDSLPPFGFINKGHQTFIHEFICFLNSSEKQLVYTPECFSIFLGNIDNIEEAFLFLESQELEYVFYTFDYKSQTYELKYNETPSSFILQARYVPWIKQNSSIFDPNEELTKKEKKIFQLVLNRKTKKIKIKK